MELDIHGARFFLFGRQSGLRLSVHNMFYDLFACLQNARRGTGANAAQQRVSRYRLLNVTDVIFHCVVIPCGFSGRKMEPMASPGYESESKQVLEVQLRATLEVIPAYTWYATPSGVLTFVNKRHADFLGLPSDHPLRLGIDVGGQWDSHLPLLHPDDHAEMRKAWSQCLRSGCHGEVSFRARNAEGAYRWFLSRVEPLRASDGSILYWISSQ